MESGGSVNGRRSSVAVTSADDLTVDLLRFVASGVTLAVAVLLMVIR